MSRPGGKGPKGRKSIAGKLIAYHVWDMIALLIAFNILVLAALSSFALYKLCITSVAISEYAVKSTGAITKGDAAASPYNAVTSPDDDANGAAAKPNAVTADAAATTLDTASSDAVTADIISPDAASPEILPDIPNALFDRYSVARNIYAPPGARVLRPAASLLGLPDNTHISLSLKQISDISFINKWAEVRSLFYLPYGDGQYNEIIYIHNTLFIIVFRAVVVLLIIQTITVFRGLFHISRRTRKTLQPITELTLAAQSFSDPSVYEANTKTCAKSCCKSGTQDSASDRAKPSPLFYDYARKEPDSSGEQPAAAPEQPARAAPDSAGEPSEAAPKSSASITEPAEPASTPPIQAQAPGQIAADARPAADDSNLQLSGAIDTLNMITEQHLDRRISIDDERVELKGLASAINSMLDRLDAAYQAQLRFVSDASHELRTPISVIQGYANLLDRWGKNDEKTLQESIDAIKNESGSMQALVEQLLFLARSDNRSITVAMRDVDVSVLVSEVAHEAKMIDEEHEYQLKIEDDLIARGDYQLLKQALRVFIDNSVKYTPTGGRISLVAARSETSPGYLDVSVRDDGIGIPEEALPKIFDRFFRADESRARSSGGTGLGLSIARWIVDSHRGMIDVVSRKDAGTKITMSIPATQ